MYKRLMYNYIWMLLLVCAIFLSITTKECDLQRWEVWWKFASCRALQSCVTINSSGDQVNISYHFLLIQTDILATRLNGIPAVWLLFSFTSLYLSKNASELWNYLKIPVCDRNLFKAPFFRLLLHYVVSTIPLHSVISKAVQWHCRQLEIAGWNITSTGFDNSIDIEESTGYDWFTTKLHCF